MIRLFRVNLIEGGMSTNISGLQFHSSSLNSLEITLKEGSA